MTAHTLEIAPAGPFELAAQNRLFNPWPTRAGDLRSAVMGFPVEGWSGTAVVAVEQLADGRVVIEARSDDGADLPRAAEQAAAALSLDIDATRWPGVAERDPVVAAILRRTGPIRPSLFHSPYEAAAAFVIGHRISVTQARILRERIARACGPALMLGDEAVAAFPDPRAVLALDSVPGLNGVKTARLHGVAQAALDGRLDRAALRALTAEDALDLLRTIDGIGPFFAAGILHRGAGVPDVPLVDDRTLELMREAYERPDARPRELAAIVEGWAPFASWGATLMHLAAAQPHRRG